MPTVDTSNKIIISMLVIRFIVLQSDSKSNGKIEKKMYDILTIIYKIFAFDYAISR